MEHTRKNQQILRGRFSSDSDRVPNSIAERLRVARTRASLAGFTQVGNFRTGSVRNVPGKSRGFTASSSP